MHDGPSQVDLSQLQEYGLFAHYQKIYSWLKLIFIGTRALYTLFISTKNQKIKLFRDFCKGKHHLLKSFFIKPTQSALSMKITKRDLIVASVTACLTLTCIFANPKIGILESSIFDWNTIAVKNTKIGSVKTFFRSQTATLDELECHVTTLNPGEDSHPPHKHAEEEVIIIKDGTVEALVNGEKKRVGPGSVIFQASNQMHSLRNVGKTPATYHVFSWHSPGTLER